ncbi:type VI secretion system protein ImpF [Pseudomonas sp. SJZ080]|uniref:type VI secretion system baseplate subunit TssE n=1 Tax=Pseudomonas sp. SJZ080 TaxID=2572888 RepID=UPI00119A73B0|nr:GPW/gp25 family protein [Pseudomonas sp. SJZ080]TWC46135.1 type VI secretion system protein ImpF [Pseudomonas sp. SJZ080]
MNTYTYTLLERLSLHEQPALSSRSDASKSYLLARLKADLNALFNASGLGQAFDPRATPHVARSVLNYGVGSIAGSTLSGFDPRAFEERIRRAVIAFEPRIIRHSLHITWGRRSNASIPEVQFIIEGQLREAAVAHPFKFCSVWNTESGEARVSLPDTRAHHG